jgi:hypothetical protein
VSEVNDADQKVKRIMIYILPEPGPEKGEKDQEDQERVEKAPEKTEKRALILQLKVTDRQLLNDSKISFVAEIHHSSNDTEIVTLCKLCKGSVRNRDRVFDHEQEHEHEYDQEHDYGKKMLEIR